MTPVLRYFVPFCTFSRALARDTNAGVIRRIGACFYLVRHVLWCRVPLGSHEAANGDVHRRLRRCNGSTDVVVTLCAPQIVQL